MAPLHDCPVSVIILRLVPSKGLVVYIHTDHFFLGESVGLVYIIHVLPYSNHRVQEYKILYAGGFRTQ